MAPPTPRQLPLVVEDRMSRRQRRHCRSLARMRKAGPSRASPSMRCRPEVGAGPAEGRRRVPACAPGAQLNPIVLLLPAGRMQRVRRAGAGACLDAIAIVPGRRGTDASRLSCMASIGNCVRPRFSAEGSGRTIELSLWSYRQQDLRRRDEYRMRRAARRSPHGFLRRSTRSRCTMSVFPHAGSSGIPDAWVPAPW
jgi:hypothetical protein